MMTSDGGHAVVSTVDNRYLWYYDAKAGNMIRWLLNKLSKLNRGGSYIENLTKV